MLQPARTKYRKSFRGRMKGNAKGNTFLAFGSIGLKSIDRGYLTSRQIESARKVISRYTKKGGKLWIRQFPHIPYTKGKESMGGGKSPVDHYVAKVRPGAIIFELEGLPESQAKEALIKASKKLPFKCTIITEF